MKHLNGPLYKTTAGLYFEPGGFYLDPVRAVETGIVSHAHFDHFCRGIKNVYASAETCGLIHLRTGGFPGILFACSFREPFMVNGVKVTLFPAGHILGSSMILLEHDGTRYLYTGDFKTAVDPTCEPFEATTADVLICESTYADPSVIHPPDETLITKLKALPEANIIIGAYVLGKAQRLTELLCREFPGRQVMVHPDIVPYHHFYEHHNVSVGNWQHYDYADFKKSSDTFLIVPPKVLSTYSRSGTYHTFMASSYAGNWSGLQLLKLSDHADWNGFEKLIAEVKPRSVITTHGEGANLKEHFKDMDFIHC